MDVDFEFQSPLQEARQFKRNRKEWWSESEDAKKDEQESRRVEVANNEVEVEVEAEVEVEVANNARSEALLHKNSGSF